MSLRDVVIIIAGLCRRIKFSTWISGYALKYHVIKNLSLFPIPSIHSACKNQCIMDPVCVSVNIGPPTKDKFICELSDSDHIRHPKDVKRREGFMYMGPEVIYIYTQSTMFSFLNLTKAHFSYINIDKKMSFLLIRITRASVIHVFMIRLA